MGMAAKMGAQYEALVKAKDAEIAAVRAANAALQAAQTQSAPDLMDDQDKAAFARAAARFPEMVDKPPVHSAPVIAAVPVQADAPLPATVVAPQKFVAPPDPT